MRLRADQNLENYENSISSNRIVAESVAELHISLQLYSKSFQIYLCFGQN